MITASRWTLYRDVIILLPLIVITIIYNFVILVDCGWTIWMHVYSNLWSGVLVYWHDYCTCIVWILMIWKKPLKIGVLTYFRLSES